jgi:uncharacterized protein (DUF302 family)
LTGVDVRETLKKKRNIGFRKYKILGACNPSFAHQALQLESRIGTMLPCNAIAQEREDVKTEVSAINPLERMKAVANPNLKNMASQVAAKLTSIIDRL